MNDEPEFNPLHMYLGTIIFCLIINFICGTIGRIFENYQLLVIVFYLIVISAAFYNGYKEFKIWARVN